MLSTRVLPANAHASVSISPILPFPYGSRTRSPIAGFLDVNETLMSVPREKSAEWACGRRMTILASTDGRCSQALSPCGRHRETILECKKSLPESSKGPQRSLHSTVRATPSILP
ncbi:hypothetical protein SCLCIDRAFT_463826 [Scleroderma citrinum Foug A]|uniref:Uncharacterized protein n=1 Tax=Scleroderma citrinum Foug A TaxID=1036808 RepID=A0A0C3D9P6_9AGAM|nr:hypothetical protein SCLCIDRAFT_463826 [Scleroderma citrinum Foug A]